MLTWSLARHPLKPSQSVPAFLSGTRSLLSVYKLRQQKTGEKGPKRKSEKQKVEAVASQLKRLALTLRRQLVLLIDVLLNFCSLWEL